MEHRVGPARGVEQEGAVLTVVLGAAPQPAVGVAHAPDGEGELLGAGQGHEGLGHLGDAGGLALDPLLTRFQVEQAVAGAQRGVQFGDVDGQTELSQLAHEGGALAGGNVDVEVALRAQAGDRRPGLQQPFDQPQIGRALHRIVLEIVVVEEEDGVRRGLFRLFEGADDVGVDAAQTLTPDAVAQALAVLGHRLIDHVPADHLAAPAPGDGGDIAVVFGGEAGTVAGQGFEPGMVLRIPDQGVAIEAQAQVAGEIGDAVGGVEAQRAVRLEDVLHLHLPLGRELGEVLRDQLEPGLVRQLARHAGRADREGGEGLQRADGAAGNRRRCFARTAGGEGDRGGEEGAARHAKALSLEGGGLGGGAGSRAADQGTGGVTRVQPGSVSGSSPIPDPSPLEGEGGGVGSTPPHGASGPFRRRRRFRVWRRRAAC